MSVRHSAIGSFVFTSVLVISSSAAASPVTVNTAGVIDRYSGPVGAPINPGPGVDPAFGPSIFGDGSSEFFAAPQAPYPDYPWPEFDGAGTAEVLLGTRTVTFRNTLDSMNILTLAGTTTHNVEIGDLFHIATISFHNGDWFSSTPDFDPGNGLLYPLSRFRFTLTATTSTPTGTEPHVWTDTLILISTRGVGTPDNLLVENSPFLGGFAIPEGRTASVDVWGRLGSLEPVEFRNLRIHSVPEPSTIQLIGLGLLSLVAQRMRRASRKPA